MVQARLSIAVVAEFFRSEHSGTTQPEMPPPEQKAALAKIQAAAGAQRAKVRLLQNLCAARARGSQSTLLAQLTGWPVELASFQALPFQDIDQRCEQLSSEVALLQNAPLEV